MINTMHSTFRAKATSMGRLMTTGKLSLLFTMGLACSTFTAPALAQCPAPVTYTASGGAATNSFFGLSVSNAGDINNDGFEDFVVGAPFRGFNNGSVYTYSGQTGFLIYLKSGVNAEQYGYCVAAAGDINHDNFADVIVGAPDNDSGGSDRGIAYVLAGPSGATTIRTFLGANVGDHFGWAVGGGMDVNNDGTDDLIVGAPESDTFGVNSGYVAVYSGATGARLRLHGGSAGDYLGFSVCMAGNINGDANRDYAAGGPYSNSPVDSAGKVVVYSGATGAVLYSWAGTYQQEFFGNSIAGGGDWNDDGRDDLLIGSPGHDTTGVGKGAVVVRSGLTGAQIAFRAPFVIGTDAYGGAVAWAGKQTNDNFDEAFVGAPTSLANSGRVFGMLPGAGKRFGLAGAPDSGYFGYSVSAGDFNNDGFPDLIVGAPCEGGGANCDGMAFVYHSSDVDNDGVSCLFDNCPTVPNPLQQDVNNDGIGDACSIEDTLRFTLLSPVDMVVTDPTGDSIGIGFNTIAAASTYDTLTNWGSTPEPDDRVTIPHPIEGSYEIRIIREPGTPDSAKFTLTIRINGNQQLIPDGYADQAVSALGTTVPDTYVWTAALTLPGDANADGIWTAADIIYMVNYVFKSGPAPVVDGHGDVNCSGAVTSADIIALVNFIFKGGAPPCSQSAG